MGERNRVLKNKYTKNKAFKNRTHKIKLLELHFHLYVENNFAIIYRLTLVYKSS